MRISLQVRRHSLSPLIYLILIVLAGGACVFIGPKSQGVRVVNNLPTFTRTPLPTLSPTPFPSTTVVIESQVAVIPTATPSSVETNPIEASFAATPVPVESSLAGAAGTTPADTAQGVETTVEATNSPTPSVTATATELPTSTSTPSPSPTLMLTFTPTPLPGWLFTGAQSFPSPYSDGLVLYGNVTNNTGTSQELKAITGTFYDTQGQIIAAPKDTYSYWPGYVMPHGGSMPFELAIEGINNIANFNLSVEAEPSNETPQQGFEFSNINQQYQNNSYCLQGDLRNLGGQFQDYLLIAAILYDSQDKVISFGDYQEFGFTEIVGDQTSSFEICVDPLNQNVARYELQAWGR